jgi:hypothetical protein
MAPLKKIMVVQPKFMKIGPGTQNATENKSNQQGILRNTFCDERVYKIAKNCQGFPLCPKPAEKD